MADHVIVHEDKRAKFEAESLCIIAPPFKESHPAVMTAIYLDIAMAHVEEGNSAQANMFLMQAKAAGAEEDKIHEVQKALNELIRGHRRPNRSPQKGLGARWWEAH
jgi:hypothetical protein